MNTDLQQGGGPPEGDLNAGASLSSMSLAPVLAPVAPELLHVSGMQPSALVRFCERLFFTFCSLPVQIVQPILNF